ncbi:EthD family reductase [Streptomyces brasiliensis]|uniref:EthD family reductase n=1 Tax=Streptomyces brasiliensis TaxID=1954 RepID=UPI00167100D9
MTARFIALHETPAAPAAFDRHYHDAHIPLARRLPGLRSADGNRPLPRTALRPAWPTARSAPEAAVSRQAV